MAGNASFKLFKIQISKIVKQTFNFKIYDTRETYSLVIRENDLPNVIREVHEKGYSIDMVLSDFKTGDQYNVFEQL
jgi:hypothetical protein